MIELALPVIIAALLSGAMVGVLLGAFGGGGSVLAAPLLLYAVGVNDPHVAIGTSSAAVAANALFNLAGHARSGRVKWPCGLAFAGAGLAGSIIGSSIAKAIDGRVLLLAFAVAMAAIALSMMRKRRDEGDAEVHITPTLAARIMPLGLAVGLLAGFFGIGGGFLIVPGLMLATGMTMAHASASSLVSVTIFGSATAGNFALAGFVDWRLAGLLLIGGAFGGLAGLKAAHALAPRALLARRLFAVLVLATAAYVAWNAVGALTS